MLIHGKIPHFLLPNLPATSGPTMRYYLTLLLLLPFTNTNVQGAADTRPNLVIVLCDDLGNGDLGCYGNKVVSTPHLDQFAVTGTKFTRCYSAAPNCSPSRTGLMTGRTPYRAGIHNWIPLDSPMHVRRHEIMLSRILKDAGYQTCHFGKWHMNGNLTNKNQPQPGDHGFDWSFGTQNNALPCHKDPTNFVRNGKAIGNQQGFAADIVTDEAIRWINEERDDEKPFFMFVAYHEPHEPIASDHKYTKLYKKIGKPSRYDPSVSSFQAHHGNLTQMDSAFGRLIHHLDETHLRDNTVVFFTSDNGPAITGAHPHGSTGGLRDKKGSVYEGGIRVPGILHWPAKLTHAQIIDTPISGVDVLPTFCEIAGANVPDAVKLDGTSIVPALQGIPLNRINPLYWQFHGARGEDQVAIIDGDWKLVGQFDGSSLKPHGDIFKTHQNRIHNAKIVRYRLYNLANDEATDVSNGNPKVLNRLTAEMTRMLKSVQSDNPTWPAWTWPRLEGKQINAYVESLQDQ
jgi:arylsulfatase A